MEIWRVGYGTAPRPKVVSARNLAIALLGHLAAFVLFYLYSVCHGLFQKANPPPIEFFDPTVVVVENLKGNEDEPPPLKKPDPPPPPPPKPKVKPPKPKPKPDKALEQMATNVVKKIDKKKDDDKKKTVKKDDPPKKTAKELREERIRKMRDSAKPVNKTTVVERQPNGRTDKRPPNWEKILNDGHRPGKTTNLSPNEEALGFSLVKRAFEEKWDKPPWTDTLKPMVIRVWFGNGGRIVKFNLESSSGDARADQSIRSAASRVGAVANLPASFIDKYKSDGVPIRFTVTAQ